MSIAWVFYFPLKVWKEWRARERRKRGDKIQNIKYNIYLFVVLCFSRSTSVSIKILTQNNKITFYAMP
jgi:hypothetical protein